MEQSAGAGTGYDVVGRAPLTSADLPRICADTVGSRARFVPVLLTPIVTVSRSYERLGLRPWIRAEQLQRPTEDKAFAIDEAVRNLGHAPHLFADRILAEPHALGLAR